ncbi:unnamed protein product [Allacma fusca]|uniref:Uncharacterized protein n=1 Tax=Allacma fusca TaxID=39272 RepID=A0A8J2MGQ7_9HEXA|nr:unnamed protein product [Allacma fusca]
MKSTVVFLLLAVSFIMLVSVTESSGDCSAEQFFRCFQDCKYKGHHGMCEYGSCSCISCYYRACKVKCAREGKIGQCQDDLCTCLG